ncbi:hypothetical protein FTO60_02940 [Octadecabacter sp. SW4]|uniref:hypothetical protein n=1 Tax=Octadecabacter sp. SW4 TaxID=2602067 RepID=UPI0011C20C9F|nr:hypothetical protein [Octadecabacter sp. SW4]QEE34758.1 hypothetical protein FTO60_02940 [Octadecabacter sp. SW4]
MSDEIPKEYIREVNLEYYRINMELTRDLGLFAIKTLMTLNSGAFIVLLTFIGNTAAESQFVVSLDELKNSLLLFLLGLGLTALSIAVTYVHSQKASPYPNFENDISDKKFLLLMMGFPTLAFLAFVAGVILLISGLTTA